MEWLSLELENIKERGLYRKPGTVESAQTPVIVKKGRELVNLSSNNYLGLTGHPYVKKAAIEAVKKYGTGAGASRLAGGNTNLYDNLEQKIARFKGTEAAVVFSTGYQANTGVIPAMAGTDDLILSDELNHASIIDGCRLSRADVSVYPHKDTTELEKILRESKHNKKLIVTDGIFSMDGDIAPLPEIIELVGKYGAMVMVDDAHATGVLGKHCRGTPDYFNVEVDINMGTLSKALGSMGGYVAGSSELVDFLRNRARSFIYSTALPPPAVAAASAAIDVIEKEQPAKRLFENVRMYKKGLVEIGYNVTSETQIMYVMVGDAGKTCDVSAELERMGVFAPAIRPPTVPEGKGRIRTSLMATHTADDIEKALSAFQVVKGKFGI
ncbi:MAG: 8-amino-7-oxononanoate synthase [Candidatus Methanoperedenaceae archaeon]|nr:8-amino-7-oxononanoate synthase [Candidatus Methanoperedenaceae archaeon]